MAIFKREDILQCFYDDTDIKYVFCVNRNETNNYHSTVAIRSNNNNLLGSRDAHRFNLIKAIDNKERDLMYIYGFETSYYKGMNRPDNELVVYEN